MKSTIWMTIQTSAKQRISKEPIFKAYLNELILNHLSLESALAHVIADKLSTLGIQARTLYTEFYEAQLSNNLLAAHACADLEAVVDRDPATDNFLSAMLYLKGFHALQAYRLANHFWNINRRELARYIQGRSSEIFGVDIHPACRIGDGVMLDHATAIVIGETSVVESNVSLLQSVTLGGTGKEKGDRHPKIRRDVVIGAGAIILGNIGVGQGAKVGANSVVLHSVPPYTTVVGRAAKNVVKRIHGVV